MAVQYCLPIADGSYTSWTGTYANWTPTAGSPPTYAGGWISTSSAVYESCYMTARVTPRVSVSACRMDGWAMKNSSSWSLTYGTMLGASWNQSTGPVTIDTFSMNAYINLSLTVPSDATLDNSTYGMGVYTNAAADSYVGGAYFTMTYTPAGGAFMLILSTALAAIGSNVLLREMPALGRHLWRTSGHQHWLEPADYEPAWHALRAFTRPAWSF